MKNLIAMAIIIAAYYAAPIIEYSSEGARSARMEKATKRVVAESERWGNRWEADYWKKLAEDLVRNVECRPYMGPGTRHGPRYDDPNNPDMVINDPYRYWYS